MDELSFKTTLKEVAVTIDDKLYKLRELDGAGESQWRKQAGGTITVVAGKPTITNLNLKDPEITLLSLCLYDEEDKPVATAVLRTWPSTMLSRLFDVAQELSGLSKESRERLEAEAKNS